MENRAIGAVAAMLVLCCSIAAPAMSEPLRVLYAEPFQAQTIGTPGTQKAGPAPLRVRAFGRTFDLELQDNSRLLRATSPQARERIGAIQLLRGSIADAPDSWVRLTVSDGRYSGAFWDGAELYGIAPRETLEPTLLTPIGRAESGIYRLSDTQGGLLQGTCGVAADAQAAGNPLGKFRSLIRELQAAADSAFAAAPREIDISMVGDFEFTTSFGANAVLAMVERMNVVDGIFSGQIGVALTPTDFITFAADTDRFTSSDAPTLLGEFADYRFDTPAVRSRGLAHLLTGRQLNGNTVGIAYLGSLCQAREGASLTEISPFIDSALVIAHELGHNFGAPHDAEAGSACEATPALFLMAPEIGNSSVFSGCSRHHMQARIDAAACVVAARNRDLAVSGPGTIQAVANEPFDVPIDVLSVGDTAAANIILRVTVGFGSNVLSASMPDATCGRNADFVLCTLTSLAPGASARLSLRMSMSSATETTLGAQVESSNDSNTTNDFHSVRVSVAQERDVRITPAPQPLSALRGEPFEMTFDVEALGSLPLQGVQVFVDATGMAASSASIEGGSCMLGPAQLATCILASLEPGTPRRVRMQMTGDRVMTSAGVASVSYLGSTSSRFSLFTIDVLPARDIALSTTDLDRVVAIGVDTVWPIEVRSVGARAVDDVHVTFTRPAWVDPRIEGPLAASCTTAADTIDCNLGTMAPGAVQTLLLRAGADEPAGASIELHAAVVPEDDVFHNDRLSLGLSVRVAQEIFLLAPAHRNLFDEQQSILAAEVVAAGANDSENIVATVALPAGFTIASATLPQGQCSVTQPTAATCSLARLTRGIASEMRVAYTAAEAGVFTGTVSVAASEDFDPSNNTRTVTFHVAPGVDGALQAPPPQQARTDQPADFVFMATSNKYALTDARVDFTWAGALEEFSAMAPGATCAGTGGGYSCDLGTLAPHSTIPITVRARSAVSTSVQISASLRSPAETQFTNNFAFVTFEFMQPGDLALSVAQSTLGATAGQRVEVAVNMNALGPALDGFLEITFDPTRMEALTVSRACFVRQPLRCPLGSMLAAGSYVESISFIPRGVGSLPLTFRVGARNDFNAANDQLTITVNVTDPPPPPPPPPPPSSGGGGGGSMSWLLAALLLAMWHHRRLHRRR